MELEERAVPFARQRMMQVTYHQRRIGEFKCDFLVAGRLLIEIKAGRPLDDSHVDQLLNYMRAMSIGLGLLIHFGERVTVRRFVL